LVENINSRGEQLNTALAALNEILPILTDFNKEVPLLANQKKIEEFIMNGNALILECLQEIQNVASEEKSSAHPSFFLIFRDSTSSLFSAPGLLLATGPL